MYRPRVVPKDAGQDWWQQELQNIAAALQSPVDGVVFKTLYAEPSRLYDGLTVKADGTVWKPNGTGGAGVYCYEGSTWKKLTN